MVVNYTMVKNKDGNYRPRILFDIKLENLDVLVYRPRFTLKQKYEFPLQTYARMNSSEIAGTYGCYRTDKLSIIVNEFASTEEELDSIVRKLTKPFYLTNCNSSSVNRKNA